MVVLKRCVHGWEMSKNSFAMRERKFDYSIKDLTQQVNTSFIKQNVRGTQPSN